MRIAICTDQYIPQLGGVPDTVVTHARGLRENGHDVQIFAPLIKGTLDEKDVRRFSSVELAGGVAYIVLPFGMTRALREYRPDLIHVHSFGTMGLVALYAGFRLKIPVIGTCHGSPVDYLHYFKMDYALVRFLVRKYFAWFYNRCAYVTAPAQQPLDAVISWGMHRPTRVISNAIDPDLFKPTPDKAALKAKLRIPQNAIVIFGRIAVEKNLDAAVAIAAATLRKVDGGLVVIGEGSYRPQMEERIREIGLASKTKFLGLLRGQPLTEALNACDVMLITSLSEAQPMTILQAAACGIPVVGARAGGIPECIDDGQTGFVVNPRHAEESAAKIIRLLGDASLAKEFGEAARKKVALYGPREIAKRFLEIYGRVIPRAISGRR